MDTRHYAVLLAGVVVLSTGMATAVPSASSALQQETSTVSFTDQSVEDGTVTVESATLPEGGFVVIHAVDDGEPGEVIGVSEFLGAGTATDVPVQLDEDLDEEQDLVAMTHLDTDGDEAFDFVETDGAEDGPYTDEAGEAVTDTATVAPAETEDDVEEPADEAEEPDDEEADEAEEDTEAAEGFVVTDLDAPSNATIGRTLSVSATVENSGDEEQTQRVEFRFEGALVADRPLTLDAGEDETVTFDVRTGLYNLTDGQFSHGVFTEDDGQVATINLTQSFEVTDFSAPESADVGDNVTVEATIENPNEATSTQGVAFRFDGAVVDNTTLTLAGGENETATFAVNSSGLPNETFVHAVFTRTDGVFASIELVEAPEPPTETPEPNTTETPSETEAPTETETPAETGTEAPAATETSTETGTEAPAETGTETAAATETSTEPGTETAATTETPAETGTETAAVTETSTEPGTETPAETGTSTATEASVPVTEVQQTATPEPGTETPSTQESASVNLPDQASDGRNVTVENVSLPDGGFVAIHNQTLFEGDAVGSVIGVSASLEPGEYENVTITLFDVPGATYENDTLAGGETLVAMPHQDTNENSTYEFVATDGSADGPYLNETGDAVVDDGRIIVETGTPAE